MEQVIGIEVHVELKSNSKVFSYALNDFNINANTNVSEVDLAYPGTLPRLNKKVVEMALQASLAFNCEINKVMHFDRKNYFYPDLPKGYQITQNDTPIGYNGYIEINDNGITKKIGIERIHIEEDTCKSIHSASGTLLNANRAGVPLIEIVSKPDIRSSKEAVLYLEKLREILLYLGISDVKIEEGSMRCDCNVSVHEENTPFGTKCEVKNIGSITNVGLAIEYETKRQIELIKNNEKVREETRRYDDKSNKTILMRVKETGNDYRYHPEPDIPFLILDDEWINEVRSKMPVFADTLKEKYKNLGINDNNIKTIISRLDLCKYLEDVIDKINPILASNLITGDILSYLNKNCITIDKIKLTKENFIKIVNKLDKNELSSKQVKELLNYILENGGNTEDVINKLSLVQISDDNLLKEIIKNIVNNNPSSVEDYKNGRDRAIKYLMGQIMKETKGSANPVIVNKLLIDTLNSAL